MAKRKKTTRSSVSEHCLIQLQKRCGISIEEPDVLKRLRVDTGRMLFKAANGDFILIKVGGRFGVVVERDGILTTAVTLEHAFANCPKAAFHALMCAGEMVPALNMRAMHVKGLLPTPHGTDDGNYKYAKAKAQIVWDTFIWSDPT